MRGLGEEDRLALRAAVLPRADASTAWITLLSRTPWMELSGPVQRCLAAIAVNLGCQSRTQAGTGTEVPHSARLAGVYRSTWSVNVLRIRALEPVLAAFDERAIDYRVLKGTAICALADRWGTRRMGDMDLAVEAAHAAASVRILRNAGFSPRFFRRITDADPPSASCWEGPDGQILDLHIGRAGRKRGDVIDAMFASPAMRIDSQGRSWPTPSREVMAVHAASHARTGAAASDHIQAVLDLALILPGTDPVTLEATARTCGASAALARLQQELADTTGEPMRIVRPHRAEPLISRIEHLAGAAVRLPQVLSERASECPEITGANVRSGAYRLWRRSGDLRPIERAVFQTFGGFLHEGSLDTARDRRRRIEVPPVLWGRMVEVRVTCADPYARLLFVDGVSQGVLNRAAKIRLERAPRTFELSLRLLGDPPSTELAKVTVSVGELQEEPEDPAWT